VASRASRSSAAALGREHGARTLSERIQKALANAGLGSRRAIERWVIDGRITIDGRVAKLGDQVGGRERVCVDGRLIKLSPEQARSDHQYLAYYKNIEPRAGSESQDSEPLLELPRPRHGRWIDVGALDPNSSGLLILTTDGELAFRLTRPATIVEREYAVRVLGEPSAEQLRELEVGVQVDEGVARVASIEHAGGTANNRWYHVVLREGRHRELRMALGAVGLAVNRVIRVRFGPIELNTEEVDGLYALAGLAPPRPSQAKRGATRAGAHAAPRASRGSRAHSRR
jgi:23S rRNA pseudouridine2605 synthase